MTRQLLPHDVTAEDRARGCIWASTFRRPGDEAEKLGTLGGAPTINRGLTLDGTNDWIEYLLWGQFDIPTTLSYQVEFNPSFAFADGNNHYLFDAVASLEYAIRKTATDFLAIYFGGTSTPQYDASAIWVQNGRNVLTTTSNGTTVDSWLNGVQIHDGAACVWTPTSVTEFHVGQRSTDATRWGGTVDHVKIYNTVLTAEDHNAIWAGGGGGES